MDKTRKKEIATEILRQLGGRKFTVMTGSKNYVFDSSDGSPYLRMDLAKNKSSANRLKITLNSMDTYDMEFYRLQKKRGEFDYDVVPVEKHEGVYNEMLAEIFTKVTGLYTKL